MLCLRQKVTIQDNPQTNRIPHYPITAVMKQSKAQGNSFRSSNRSSFMRYCCWKAYCLAM